MKTRNSTKSKLLSSVIALVLCVSMLIGATFAWFTDTASTAVNKIQAGTLDVALEMYDGANWVSAEGKTLQFKVNGAIPALGTQILWEPGCTYELPELRVVNKGNLALKYKIEISGIVGDAKLLEAIDFTYGDNININAEVSLAPNAATEGIVIKGHMQESAGNEYQGKSIDGIGITVYATQNTVEFDSINNQYDKDALYPVLAPVLNNTDSIEYASAPTTEKTIANDKAVSKIPANTKIYKNTSDNTPITPASGGELQRVLKTTNSSADSVTYDIGYNYVNGSSTTEVHKFSNVVENIIQLSTGLKEVKVTHNGTAMTEATTPADGTYSYDAATGKLYIYSSTYSSYTISYKSEHEVAVDGQGMSVAAFRDSVNAGNSYAGKTVVLLRNLNLSGSEWTPIGTAEHPFSGTFDGNNKTISNLKITAGNYAGLFGYVSTATIKNVKLANAQVSGGERMASLIGRITDDATVTNCSNDAASSVTGSDSNTGGLIGEIVNGTVELSNLVNNAAVKNTKKSNSRAGGVVAQVTTGANVTLTNCTNNGAVNTNNGYAGGIVSAYQSGSLTIDNCANTGALVGEYKGNMLGWYTSIRSITISSATNEFDINAIGCIDIATTSDMSLYGKHYFVNKKADLTGVGTTAQTFSEIFAEGKIGTSPRELWDKLIAFYAFAAKTNSNFAGYPKDYWSMFNQSVGYSGSDWDSYFDGYNAQCGEGNELQKSDFTSATWREKIVYLAP